jgi:phage terminase large subunit GpA-like protein
VIPTAEAPTPRQRLARLAAATVRRLCTIPTDHTTTEWADRHRRLPESSTAPGRFDSSVAPYTRRWMDLGADPGTEMMVMCWASQTLKSTTMENIIAYRLVRMPSPIMLVRPSQEDGENWSKERFAAMVRVTPQLAARYKPRQSTLRYRKFDGAFLWVASSQSEADLSSWSAPIVIIDEADRMQPLPQGNPVEIASRRMGAADVGTLIVISTPGLADDSIIWPLLEAGTFELLHVPCPHCGTKQPLAWRRETPGGRDEYCLRWKDGTKREAIYICAEGCIIEERDKRDMVAAGEWVASNPEGAYPSSHLNALYSPFSKTSWKVILSKWDAAQGKPSDLQVFINTFLAECWSETDSRVTAEKLKEAERLEPLVRSVVPTGVGLITIGVDIQDNRIEVRVWGWGEGLESWLIDKRILPGDTARDPSHADTVWTDLDQVLAECFMHESGRPMYASAVMIDSGFRPGQVYRFCDPRRTRPRANRHIYATKGKGGEREFLSKPTLQTKRRIPLYTIGTDTAKDEFLRSQIYEPTPGPGFVHLPKWASEDDELDQLVAEERKRKFVKGRVVHEWRRKKAHLPNEALDCRLGARAGVEVLGVRVIKQLGALAAAVAEPPEEPVPPPAAPRVESSVQRAARRPPRNWVTRPLG